MPHTSTDKADTSSAKDLVTTLINPAPSPPFSTLNERYCQALFHLAENFKQAIDINPKAPTIPIPIPANTPPRVPQHPPPRANVSLLPSLGPRLELLRVPGSHLVSTQIYPLKVHFSTLPSRHKNLESTFSVAPKVIYSQHTGNLGHIRRLRAKNLKKKLVSKTKKRSLVLVTPSSKTKLAPKTNPNKRKQLSKEKS